MRSATGGVPAALPCQHPAPAHSQHTPRHIVLPRSADGSVDLDRRNACYDTSKRIVIKIVDTCPCQGNEVGALPCSMRTNQSLQGHVQKGRHALHAAMRAWGPSLPLSACLTDPGRPQKWCCGDAGLVHFDLSDGAFRKLAPQVGMKGGTARDAAPRVAWLAYSCRACALVGRLTAATPKPSPHHTLATPPTLQGKGIIGLAWRPVPCEAAASNGTASSEAQAALDQAVGEWLGRRQGGWAEKAGTRLPTLAERRCGPGMASLNNKAC